MAKTSKRYKNNLELIDREKSYTVSEAVGVLKSMEPGKFDETVEISFNLGVDPRKSDQVVRGAFSLPHGIGKSVRVIAFAEGNDAKEAKEAGAIEVGADDLAKKIKDGWMEFDVAIAHPQMMRFVGQLGKVLGPQGKMPSPKSGTVTDKIGHAVSEFCAGKIEFKTEKGAIVHAPVGKVSFDADKLVDNVEALIEHIKPRGHKPPRVRTLRRYR